MNKRGQINIKLLGIVLLVVIVIIVVAFVIYTPSTPPEPEEEPLTSEQIEEIQNEIGFPEGYLQYVLNNKTSNV